MRFLVLGPVEVAADAQRTRISSARRRTILAVLLAAGGTTVSRERLIDAVWGDEVPSSARKSLQSHLSRLRGELTDLASDEPDPFVTESEGYRCDLRSHELDAARFEELVARAREREGADPREVVGHLDEALDLWRGPAFGDLAANPEVAPEAVRLEELRAAAAATHVDARLRLGRHEQVVGELEARIGARPLDERAHRQLMVALYRCDRQHEALATYRRLQQHLREEVGVDPSPSARDLHERILRQDPDLLAVPSVPQLGARTPSTGRPHAGDPRSPGSAARVPELIGRDEDIAAVAELIAQVPLVTLTGPGGVGKTRLAEQVAARVAERFDGSVVNCSLAGVRTPEGLGGALVTALGIQPQGEASSEQTLVSALGERRLLLLLDNCEHLLATVAPLVDTLLSRCPNLAILATSRERLHLPSEQLRQVRPLAVPEADADAEEVAATPAGALFLARAHVVEPDFALSAENAAAVAELCRRLDGMPLAIELAAARMQALTPADLTARLDRRFSLLAGGPRHEAGRHRTLQAVVAWSYELLEPMEAALFDRLSVFAGAFSLDAVEQVCAGEPVAGDEVAGLLGELVDKSMVIVERHGGLLRYRLLDTLREFGARRLDEDGLTQTLQRAHASYHVALAEELGPKVRGPDEHVAVAAIDAAFDDLRSAHARLIAAGELDGALRLPAALCDFSFYRLRDEVTTWIRRALDLPGAPAHDVYGAALAAAAQGATSRDECARAHREAQAALSCAEAVSLTSVRAYGALGAASMYEGRLDDTLDYAQRQDTVAEQLGQPFYRAFARVLRIMALLYRGDQDAAIGYVPDLHAAAEACGSPSMRAFAHYCAGETRLDADPEQAATSLERAVELAGQMDNALIEGVSLVSLASLRGRQRQVDEALRLFRQVVVHWQRLGDHTHQITTVRNLVELLTQIGADEPAAELYGSVTTGLLPSFGAEAQRLATAWSLLEQRLGAGAAQAAAARGRELGPVRMGDAALAHLDALRAS